MATIHNLFDVRCLFALANSTDFTVFKEANWMGLNFALIGGAHRYHTLEDILLRTFRIDRYSTLASKRTS